MTRFELIWEPRRLSSCIGCCNTCQLAKSRTFYSKKSITQNARCMTNMLPLPSASASARNQISSIPPLPPSPVLIASTITMNKDPVSEILQLSLMLLALLALLFFANTLFNLGVFDALPLTRQSLPPLLLALTPVQSTPGTHPSMQTLLDAVAPRGVYEESSILGIPATTITRGERIAIYSGPIHPLSTFSALVGVVLDTGDERVTPRSRSEWTRRLAQKGLRDFRVCIINVNDALCIPARWEGAASETVGVWRVYRKLAKRWRRVPEKRGLATTVLHAFSENRKRSVAVLPVDCTKNIIVEG